MSEANWYYARGDEEFGPIPSAELKELAKSGGLQPNDLVWKEGMRDWSPAGDVKGLFPAPESPPPTPSPESPPAVDSPPLPLTTFTPADAGARQAGSTRARRKLTFEPLKYGRTFGQPALIVGLLLVLFARGCDAVGNRSVARLSAKVAVAQSGLSDMSGIEPAQREVLREKLEEMRKDADNARYHNQMWGYWRELLFVFGSMVLAVGLLATGFTGEGAERWICLVMLAVITYSLFVGGVAWLSSIGSLGEGPEGRGRI